MATENGIPIPTRKDFLEGQRIERVEEQKDADGAEWTVLRLENGRTVHISGDSGWVLSEAQVN